MAVHTEEIHISTRREGEMIDLKETLRSVAKRSGISVGTLNCFVPGATGALTFIEYEPGLLGDFPNMLERIAPKGIEYGHDIKWKDGNGHSHVRASLIGADITIPVRDKDLCLGRWQTPTFLELDVRPRDRKLLVTVIGE